MAEAAGAAERRPALIEGDAWNAAGVSAAVLAMRVLAARARFALRADASRLPEGGQIAGFDLAMAMNRRTGSSSRTAVRLGPDEWLLYGPASETARIASDVEAAFAGRRCSLVDAGHRTVAFAVSGTRAADVLNAGCPLDLSPAAFPAGMATRTLLGKCEVILAKLDAAPTFEVECGRSLATYVQDFLREAARELRAGT